MENVHNNDIVAPRGDAGLNQTQEETSSEESRPILHETLRDGNTSEDKHRYGNWKNSKLIPSAVEEHQGQV